MKTTFAILGGIALIGGASLVGCGDDTSSASNSTTSSTSTSSSTGGGGNGTGGGGGSGGGGNPAAPALGSQIDRFGRPAINTALNHTFDVDAAKKDAAKDAYNADKLAAKWSATYTPEFATNLAILDSLDTVCGNQAFAGNDPIAGRYNTLAGVLADDRVWVKTDATSCTTYLAVEANATMFLPNGDCGGRKLAYDVIDESYSLLAIGMVAGVGDGIAADEDTNGAAFPYLAAPH